MSSNFTARKGARRLSDVPPPVLKALAAGTIETVNLMEWLAADMATLARCVSNQIRDPSLRKALRKGADQLGDLSITARLTTIGRAVSRAVPDLDDGDFTFLAAHSSDLVRQWACYAVNDDQMQLSLVDRLKLTFPFAADQNMTVREAAWMAFRPHILPRVEEAVALLEPLTRDSGAFVRRFAVEVTRPRSVWGLHCEHLKRRPQEALSLLENVRQDAARYVQLAVGNWLNDASKSRPEWVVEICERWSAEDNPHTTAITRRGLRTIARRRARSVEGGLLGAMFVGVS
jgi:3-methyladenine DNA glycosylase AlkC